MGETFGRRALDARSGHPLQVSADGNPVHHPIGITIDWEAVPAVEDEDVDVGGTIVKVGQKYLRYGQVLVKDADTGKWKPWGEGALSRGRTAILNQTVLQNGAGPGLTSPPSDHPAVINGGLVWKNRLLADDELDDVDLRQRETATVVGAITLDGDAEVIVTAEGLTGSPVVMAVAVQAGQPQIETATVSGAIESAGAGDVEVIVIAAGMPNSPKTVLVAVANDDTAADVAGKIRVALAGDEDIGDSETGFFVVSGTSDAVVLTAAANAANDATMNISIDNDTSIGLTPAPTSANTQPGVAPDNAAAVASKIRTALSEDEGITDFFIVSGSGPNVVLTARVAAPHDPTMNISIDNDTCEGLEPAPESVDSQEGLGLSTGPALGQLLTALPLLRLA